MLLKAELILIQRFQYHPRTVLIIIISTTYQQHMQMY